MKPLINPRFYPLHLIFIGSLCLFSCGNPPQKVVETKKSIPIFTPSTYANDSLILGLPFKFKNKRYGFGFYSCPDSVFYDQYSLSEKGIWGKNSSTRFKNIEKILTSDTVRVEDSLYLAIDYLSANKNANKNIYFSLVNLLSKKVFTIRYHYTKNYSQLSAHYQMEAYQKKFPLQVQTLEKRAATFSMSNKNPKVETPPDLSESPIKRWVMLNDRVYEETKTIGRSFQLNIEEFSGDISPSLKDFENSDSLFKKNVITTENNQYKVSALFHGPVFCFYKNLQKSFLIWVPEDTSHYIRTTRLRGNQVLLFDTLVDPKSKYKPIYEFNLSQKIIKKTR